MTSEQARYFSIQMEEYKFRPPKTSEEKETCVTSAIPKSVKVHKTGGESRVSHVSAILEPKCTNKVETEPKDKVAINEGELNLEKNSSFCFWDFDNCAVTFNVSSK